VTSRLTHHRLSLRWTVRCAIWLVVANVLPLTAQAVTVADGTACLQASDDQAQLACFQSWARQQTVGINPATRIAQTPSTVEPPATRAASRSETPTLARDCKTRAGSTLSHFWQLTAANDCDTFRLRGYKPISVMGVFSDGANKLPHSTAANRSATIFQDYQRHEGLLQLSIRTKLATELLPTDPGRTDGLWFGYTQKSFWQVFSRGLSRPFRTTDHEPELAYIYPIKTAVSMGFTARYAGLSLNHQSNGQAVPYSRSWNRVILMAGADRTDGSQVNARIWKRMSENPSNDDNPDIANYIGRAEVSALWQSTPNIS